MSEPSTELAVLPLRDVVVYPHMVIPLFVGRDKSIRALERAMEAGKQILLVAQKNAGDDNPLPADIHTMGTVSNILQLLKLPDGTIKVLVEGVYRGRIEEFTETDDLYLANVEQVEPEAVTSREAEVLSRSLMTQFDQYVKLNKKVPPEIISSLSGIDDPSRLADTIAAHMAIKIEQKQEVLELVGLRERLEHLVSLMESEIDLLQVEKRLRGRVKKQMEKS
ncbi:MAG: LON peptidase substrate-binding domain-containing protein, partial [Microcella pacifica]